MFIFSGLYLGIFILVFIFNKINHSKLIEKHLSEFKKQDDLSTLFMFDDQNFSIKTEQYDIRCVWEKVSYQSYKKTIYIYLEIGNKFTYILDEDESPKFNEIMDFMKNKVCEK